MRHFTFSTIVAIFASLAIALSVWADVRAGTLPNISGLWYANGNANHHCHISQSGSSVSLSNERGATATGSFVNPSSLATNWGPFGGGNVTGQISSDLRTITWSNGTRWTRSPAFSSVSSSSSFSSSTQVAVAAATPTPKPYRYLHWASPGGPSAPIDYVDAWTAIEPDASAAWTCLSFKNTSSVAATQIFFGFSLLNYDREAIDRGHLDRKGTFSPNVEIHGYHNASEWAQRVGPRGYRDNCVSWNPNAQPRAREDYSHARYYSITVKRIDYADGTTWPRAEEGSPSPEQSGSPSPEPSPSPKVTSTPKKRLSQVTF